MNDRQKAVAGLLVVAILCFAIFSCTKGGASNANPQAVPVAPPVPSGPPPASGSYSERDIENVQRLDAVIQRSDAALQQQ